MKGIVLGESVETRPGDLASLVARILDGTLLAKRIDAQADGDTRYWGVDASQSRVLQRLKQFAETQFIKTTGKPPSCSIIMINVIDCEQSSNGSGGGWHRDSLRAQYKGFTYLTDVMREAEGAFAFIPVSKSPLFLLVSLLHRMLSAGNRYSDKSINALFRLGVPRCAVLLRAGIPFFVDTSLIHRGLPIAEGRRVMAAVYMFKQVPKFFESLQ